MTNVICVENLIQEPNCTCFAMVCADGMTISWGKWDSDGPMEGLHIHIPREKMLELADAIKEVKE